MTRAQRLSCSGMRTRSSSMSMWTSISSSSQVRAPILRSRTPISLHLRPKNSSHSCTTATQENWPIRINSRTSPRQVELAKRQTRSETANPMPSQTVVPPLTKPKTAPKIPTCSLIQGGTRDPRVRKRTRKTRDNSTATSKNFTMTPWIKYRLHP